jgi:hypothetical protein
MRFGRGDVDKSQTQRVFFYHVDSYEFKKGIN